MLAIRLTRTGKAHNPHYRIVVQEKRSKLTGKAIAYVGHYHPANKGKELVLDADAIRKYMAAGAQPSDTVTNLLVREGVLSEDRRVLRPRKEQPAAEIATKEEAPAVVEAAPEAEVIAEEAAPEELPAPEEAAPEETPAEDALAADSTE